MDQQEDFEGRHPVTEDVRLLSGDLPATPPPSTSSDSRRAEIVVAPAAQQSPDAAGGSNSSSSDADSTNSAAEMFSGIPSSEDQTSIISQLLAAKAAVAKLEAELAAAQQAPSVKPTPEQHKTNFSTRKEDTPAHDGGVQDDNDDSDDDACSGVHQSAFQSAASSATSSPTKAGYATPPQLRSGQHSAARTVPSTPTPAATPIAMVPLSHQREGRPSVRFNVTDPPTLAPGLHETQMMCIEYYGIEIIRRRSELADLNFRKAELVPIAKLFDKKELIVSKTFKIPSTLSMLSTNSFTQAMLIAIGLTSHLDLMMSHFSQLTQHFVAALWPKQYCSSRIDRDLACAVFNSCVYGSPSATTSENAKVAQNAAMLIDEIVRFFIFIFKTNYLACTHDAERYTVSQPLNRSEALFTSLLKTTGGSDLTFLVQAAGPKNALISWMGRKVTDGGFQTYINTVRLARDALQDIGIRLTSEDFNGAIRCMFQLSRDTQAIGFLFNRHGADLFTLDPFVLIDEVISLDSTLMHLRPPGTAPKGGAALAAEPARELNRLGDPATKAAWDALTPSERARVEKAQRERGLRLRYQDPKQPQQKEKLEFFCNRCGIPGPDGKPSGTWGHMRKECKSQKGSSTEKGQGAQSTAGANNAGGKGNLTCFKCGQPGHRAWQCKGKAQQGGAALVTAEDTLVEAVSKRVVADFKESIHEVVQSLALGSKTSEPAASASAAGLATTAERAVEDKMRMLYTRLSHPNVGLVTTADYPADPGYQAFMATVAAEESVPAAPSAGSSSPPPLEFDPNRMCLSQDDLIGSDGVRLPWTDLNSRMVTFVHDEGDITENGLDDRAAYMWDPEAEDWIPTPGGYVFWQPAGDMAAADDADARKIRTPGLTLLAAQLAKIPLSESLEIAHNVSPLCTSTSSIDSVEFEDDVIVPPPPASVDCALAGAGITMQPRDYDFDKDLANVRRIMKRLNYRNFSYTAVYNFIKYNTAVLDTGATVLLLNRLEFLIDGTIEPGSSNVKTAGGSASGDASGTCSMLCLTVENSGSHTQCRPLPPHHAVVIKNSEYNLLPVREIKAQHLNVDSCVDPPRGTEAWVTLDGYPLEVFYWQGLPRTVIFWKTGHTVYIDDEVVLVTEPTPRPSASIPDLLRAAGLECSIPLPSYDLSSSPSSTVSLSDVSSCEVPTIREYVRTTDMQQALALSRAGQPARLTLKDYHDRFGHPSEQATRLQLELLGIDYLGKHDPMPFCEACAAAKARNPGRGTGVLGMRLKFPIEDGPAAFITFDVMSWSIPTLSGAFRCLVVVDKHSGYVTLTSLSDEEGNRSHVSHALPGLILEVRTGARRDLPSVLYCDNAAENMSQEIRAECERRGWIIQFSSPNVHGVTNPVPESIINVLRTIARAMMIHATTPPPFVGCATAHAAHVRRNMFTKRPGDEKPMTAVQRLTGDMSRPDTAHLIPFGCLVIYFDTKQTNKTLARGLFGVFVGSALFYGRPGILVYSITARKIETTVSYVTDPSTFPFREGLIRRIISHQASDLPTEEAMLPDGTYLKDFVGRFVMKEFYTTKDPKNKKTDYYRGRVIGIEKVVPKGKKVDESKLEYYRFKIKYDIDGYEELIDITALLDILLDTTHALVTVSPKMPLLHLSAAADTPESFRLLPDDHDLSTHMVGPELSHDFRSSWYPAMVAATTPKEHPTSFPSVEKALDYARSVGDMDLYKAIRAAEEAEINKLMKYALVWTDLLPGDDLSRIAMLTKIKRIVDTHGQVVKVRGVHNRPKKNMPVPEDGWHSAAYTIHIPDLFLAIAWAVGKNWYFAQMDAISAYLQAEAPRDRMVYTPPASFKPPRKGQVLLALRALYGHPESGRAWFLHFSSALKQLGFIPVDRAGTWVIRRHQTKGAVMLMTVVDDCIVAYDTPSALEIFTVEIKKLIDVDVTELSTFCGLNFFYNREKRRMCVNQAPLIEEMSRRFGINKDCTDPGTPLPAGYTIDMSTCPETPDPNRATRVRQMVGTFAYVVHTRPSLKTAVSMLSRVASNPSEEHEKLCLRVIRYLWHTRFMPLVIRGFEWTGPDGHHFKINHPGCYPDSSHADGDIAIQRRSRGGYGIMYNGACINSKSTIPSGVSTSSAMSETKILHLAATEVMAMVQTLTRLGDPLTDPVPVFEDNSATIDIMTGMTNGSTSRHFEVKYFYVCELMHRKIIDLRKIATDFQLGDPFTKCLPIDKYKQHRLYLQGLSGLSPEEFEEVHDICKR